MSSIADNLRRVQERIAAAAERSGREAGAVTLVAVTKTRPVEVIQEGVDAGLEALGENRVQEAAGKVDAVAGEIEWHLVGHLQRNKVRQALGLFKVIHSVDSLRLAEEIGKRATQGAEAARVLVQVNTSTAESQFGAEPDEAPELVSRIAEIEGVSIEGLMTIGAFLPDPEEVRPCFVRLRGLRDRIADQRLPGVSMDHLSMGMTSDFEVAIEEGATIVRVGTAIFGERQK